MARGDVVFRRHALEGVKLPEKTKRIATASKGMASSFGRDPLIASAGADPERRHPLPKQAAPSPSVAAEVEDAGVPDADSTKDEIKAYLDAQGVEYTTRMTKDELLELI